MRAVLAEAPLGALGETFAAPVALRVGAPTFGQWAGATLSAESGRQLYLPEGFARGFLDPGDGPAALHSTCTHA